MFEKLKETVKKVANTPVPLGKAVLVSSILIVVSVVTTRRIDMVIVVH